MTLFAPVELLSEEPPVPGDAPTTGPASRGWDEEEQLPTGSSQQAQLVDAGIRGNGSAGSPAKQAVSPVGQARQGSPGIHPRGDGGAREAGAVDAPDSNAVPQGAPVAPASPPVKWYRSRWCRVVAIRITMRLSMIGFVIGMGFVFSFRGAVNHYADWMRGRHPQFAGILLFTVVSSLFASVAPGAHHRPPPAPPPPLRIHPDS